jgi:hypothetical protein
MQFVNEEHDLMLALFYRALRPCAIFCKFAGDAAKKNAPRKRFSE